MPPSAVFNEPRVDSGLCNGITPKGADETSRRDLFDGFTLKRTRHWESVLRGLSSRCDFSSLLKDDQKFTVNLREAQSPRACVETPIELDDTLHRHLHGFQRQFGLSLDAALQFAWHKTIGIYGNGDQTALAVFLPHEVSPSTSLAYPVCIDHAPSKLLSVRDHLVSIALKSERQRNEKDAVLVDRMNLGLFDGSFTIGSTDYGKSYLQRFPLSCVVKVSDDGHLAISVLYADELFDSELMDGLVDVFRSILAQVLATPSLSISELQCLSAAQSQELELINDTNGSYPRDKRLNELVEEAAARTPYKVAVRYKDRQLTYEELNNSANRLARYLVKQGGVQVTPEQIVALFLDKSEMMIVIVLAIWKSGACYSPIDPSYPDARIHFSLQDTGARVVLANKRHCARIRSLVDSCKVETILSVEDVFDHILSDDNGIAVTNICLELNSSQLAYVTYTSGTTGVPKGIQKRHTNVVNSITDLAERYGVKSGHEVIVLFSPYVFEPFARQTLMALLNSHVLVVVDDDTKLDPVLFPRIIREFEITYLNGTASVLQEYDYSDCPSLRKLVLVGEDLTEVRYNALRKKFAHTIINECKYFRSSFYPF